MPSKIPITTLRLKEPTNSKIRYIAEKNNKKMNEEITELIENRIKEYENEHGEIRLEKDKNDQSETEQGTKEKS